MTAADRMIFRRVLVGNGDGTEVVKVASLAQKRKNSEQIASINPDDNGQR